MKGGRKEGRKEDEGRKEGTDVIKKGSEIEGRKMKEG